MDAKVIEELKAALAKATPGPWMVDSTVALGAYGVWRDSKSLADDEPMQQVCSMLPMERRFAQEKRDADAALIVALRNNVDALIASVERSSQLERLLEAVEAENRSLKSTYCPGYQWQVKQDPQFQDKPRRGWYCCDRSGMNYLHKDRRVTQGISDQELAFWPTEIEANVFLHEWLYEPSPALASIPATDGEGEHAG